MRVLGVATFEKEWQHSKTVHLRMAGEYGLDRTLKVRCENWQHL
jgi:hypothetical protein